MLCCLLLGLGASLQAQYTGDSLYFLRPVDTVFVYPHTTSGALLFDHVLAPKQTIYGASRFYGTTVEDFYFLDPKLRNAYDVGDVIKVPIPTEVIRYERPADSLAWFAPVHYRMQPGETLYGLASRRLGWLNEAPLLALNPNLNAQRMRPGQELLIGYITIAGLPQREKDYLDAYAARNVGLSRLWELRTAGKNMEVANGKAAWTKKGDPNKFMALHRTAPLNSIIELTDPRSRKTLYARVVGRVPEQIYAPDVIVVVSPLLVKAFGVRDKNFYVRTRHF